MTEIHQRIHNMLTQAYIQGVLSARQPQSISIGADVATIANDSMNNMYRLSTMIQKFILNDLIGDDEPMNIDSENPIIITPANSLRAQQRQALKGESIHACNTTELFSTTHYHLVTYPGNLPGDAAAVSADAPLPHVQIMDKY